MIKLIIEQVYGTGEVITILFPTSYPSQQYSKFDEILNDAYAEETGSLNNENGG